MIKFAKRVAAITGLAVAALAAPTGSASAATNTNTSTPQSICGSNYTALLHSFSMPGGAAYLYYNDSNGYVCAVTIKTAHVGTPTLTGAHIGKTSAANDIHDVGNYKSFAGPVYLYAPTTCVWFGGETSTSGGWHNEGCY